MGLPAGHASTLPDNPSAEGPAPAQRSHPHSLAEAVRRARTGVPAGERTLPVSPALADLLPDGLRRGSTVGVAGPGARSLALALIAEATATGSWAAVVGDPDLGLAAAAEVGVALAHLAVVDLSGPTASRQWGAVVSALVGGLDLVLVAPRRQVRAADARRLAARARERGSVLIRIGDAPWPDRPDLELALGGATWEGPEDGYGRLRCRRAEVIATGRGRNARERRVLLLLPDARGVPSLP
ncbi:MAG: hypothetical protein CL437_01370 [Acidimicrobiaceae bacterium]|jgi:hypothetical protein|nr:hypothetical protein [Acidimicrobiaceae bacterium]MDP7542020.1 hypothetical protein [Acidimicrobiales bacterium]|tara:strand:- start:4846 stop:5568 length:723 start_codon:yes stop_codon:yes gene_type:complete